MAQTRTNIITVLAAGATLGLILAPIQSVVGGPPQGAEPWHKYSRSDFRGYQDVWEAQYPTSTLPARMASLTGSNCFVCHESAGTSAEGTCYKDDILKRLDAGRSIEQAIADVDPMDSDGDGVSNGEEITLVRADDPTQVGYHPGLIGPTGTSPCSSSPTAPRTGQPETPETVCYADCDGTGSLDFFDFLCFQNAFATGDPYADCDATGVLDFFDFLCFQNEFAAGCP